MKISGIRLRDELRPGDREHVRSLVESSGFFTPTEIDVAVELVDERFSKGAASGYHFVFADRDEQPVGYACYGPIACTLASYDLFWIAVARSCQGQGLGRMLLDEAEQRMRNLGGARIYIETSNRPLYDPTRRFYERCGYRTEAVLKDFYAPNDDKVIYLKVL